MSTFATWCRTHRKDLFLAVGFCLLFALAFGAGFLIGRDVNPAPIVIEKCSGQ